MAKNVTTGEEPRVWIGSLGSYNAGRLIGEWVEVSDNPDELREHIARVVAKGEGGEHFFADRENLPGYFGEYSSPESLSEYVEELERADLDGIPGCVFRAVCDDHGQTVDPDRIHIYGDGEVRDGEDVALALCESCGGFAEMVGAGKDLPDTVETYFDWDKYGRDLLLQGWQIVEGFAVQVD